MSALEHHDLAPSSDGAAGLVQRPHLRIVEAVGRGSTRDGWRWQAKRTFDIVVVVLMLPFLVPMMLGLAVLTKLMSPGPILFRHERIGRDGETFQMLKFRTMFVDSCERLENDPELYARYVRNDFKLPKGDDPHVVPLGAFLRASSLDELPQFFNVLRGHMSLVGPRPIVAEEIHHYGEWASGYLDVKPGITGRWQTEGRNDIRYPERAMLDAQYRDSWRLRSDVMILAKTLPCVIRRRGCN